MILEQTRISLASLLKIQEEVTAGFILRASVKKQKQWKFIEIFVKFLSKISCTEVSDFDCEIVTQHLPTLIMSRIAALG